MGAPARRQEALSYSLFANSVVAISAVASTIDGFSVSAFASSDSDPRVILGPEDPFRAQVHVRGQERVVRLNRLREQFSRLPRRSELFIAIAPSLSYARAA